MQLLNISKTEFQELVESSEKPLIVQFYAKINTSVTPLEVYTTLKDSYSYLLESVEKEERHARFSFVGSNPEAIVTIKDRELTLEYPEYTSLINYIYNSIKKVCNIPEINKNEVLFSGTIKDNYDVLDALRAAVPKVYFKSTVDFGRQVFLGGAIGYNAYDIVYDCWLDIEKKYSSDTPDIQFALMTKTIIFDHFREDVYIVLTPFISLDTDLDTIYTTAESDAKELITLIKKAKHKQNKTTVKPNTSLRTHHSIPHTPNMSKEEYENAVKIAKKHIFDGDIFQVVPSRRYEFAINKSPLELYKKLREVNPSPYMYLFEFGDLSIVGASPETLLTVHNRKVITNPIAGTCPRGATPDEDEKFAKKMLNDEKECAEHVMLVDLGRNDIRMVSKPGTVKVEDYMSVLKYSHVQHIESTVSGILRDECDCYDATRAIFPAGTLSGAPKIRAMEIIDALEKSARGIYGGGVGYYSWNGDADFAIVIRTVIIKGNKAYVQAGAGIVADSDPSREYYETEKKMAAMIKAL
ncbi:MAG: anthranilate synthase component I, partial [Methanosarcinales archaeon]